MRNLPNSSLQWTLTFLDLLYLTPALTCIYAFLVSTVISFGMYFSHNVTTSYS